MRAGERADLSIESQVDADRNDSLDSDSWLGIFFLLGSTWMHGRHTHMTSDFLLNIVFLTIPPVVHVKCTAFSSDGRKAKAEARQQRAQTDSIRTNKSNLICLDANLGFATKKSCNDNGSFGTSLFYMYRTFGSPRRPRLLARRIATQRVLGWHF